MSLNIVKGKIRPIKEGIIISDMDFGEQITQSGIVIQSDDGKSEGVKPRWGKVYAVGPDQHDVKVGEWICVEHGRWTRGFDFEDETGNVIKLRRVDPTGVMLVADNKPSDAYLGDQSTPTHGSVHNAEDFVRY